MNFETQWIWVIVTHNVTLEKLFHFSELHFSYSSKWDLKLLYCPMVVRMKMRTIEATQ
jgi:hypothetical protein